MENLKDKTQEELIKIRDNSPIDSEEYIRAKDKIKDIQGNTNNIQIGKLSDFIKQYKSETDKSIKSNHKLTLVLMAFTIIQVIIALMQFIFDAVAFKWFGLAMTIILATMIIYVIRSFDKFIGK